MIPYALRVTLSIAVICYFIIILYYLKKRMLELKYTLIWLAAGVVMGIMLIFPDLLEWFRSLLGIESNMNALYMLCFAFIIMILMKKIQQTIQDPNTYLWNYQSKNVQQ